MQAQEAARMRERMGQLEQLVDAIVSARDRHALTSDFGRAVDALLTDRGFLPGPPTPSPFASEAGYRATGIISGGITGVCDERTIKNCKFSSTPPESLSPSKQ